MSNLPDKIDVTFETNEGYEYSRTDRDILDDLVYTVNKLIEYLEKHDA